jgi:hypothetical protein
MLLDASLKVSGFFFSLCRFWNGFPRSIILEVNLTNYHLRIQAETKTTHTNQQEAV